MFFYHKILLKLKFN